VTVPQTQATDSRSAVQVNISDGPTSKIIGRCTIPTIICCIN